MRARPLEASSVPNTKRAPGSRRRAGNRKGVILRSIVFNIALEFFSKTLHFVADTHRLNLRSTHAATNAPLLRRNLRSEHPLAIERDAKKVSAQADSAIIARCNLHTRQRTNGRRGDRVLPVLVNKLRCRPLPRARSLLVLCCGRKFSRWNIPTRICSFRRCGCVCRQGRTSPGCQ